VGTWNLSLKRLNLPLVDLLHHHGGCFLIDSSVRKMLPDSFSRTIPIWACVLNRIVSKYRADLGLPPPINISWDTNLYTPLCVVSPEEHLEISNLIDDRVECLYRSQAIVNPLHLVQILSKPLRPIWISNGKDLLEDVGESSLEDDYLVIVCWNPSTYKTAATKSHIQWIDDSIENGFYYTPGAADDQESWARHLTADLFWNHQEQLMNQDLNDDDVDTLIDSIVQDTRKEEEYFPNVVRDGSVDRIGQTSLWIGSRRAGRPPDCWEKFDVIVNVTQLEYPDMLSQRGRYYLHLSVAEGKRDKTELERCLPVGLVFLIWHLQQGRDVLVHCAQGKDRSVALALALVVLVCPLVFPLRLRDDFMKIDLGKLRRSPSKHRGSENSNDSKEENYLNSGLPRELVQMLLQDNSRELFLQWMHSQLGNRVDEPLGNKETLRIGLHLIRQDREAADPTRSTMQKLNRFFMSSALYR
jgi:tRNA A64-2'-O-ribosylphosphate transferase